MDLKGKAVVVTGGASGLGAALSRRFVAEGARLVIGDIDTEALERVASDIGASSRTTDVSIESDVKNLAEMAYQALGEIDLWVSNAGGAVAKELESTDAQWESEWKLNVLSHVYAARAVAPRMVRRGSGYLLQVASSVGLAIQPDAIGYSATKRAAVAVNEWLALRYSRQGIKVSVFCPQGLRTPLLQRGLDAGQVASWMSLPEARTPEEAAEAVVQGIHRENFLILLQDRPMREYLAKAADYDGWLEERTNEYLEVAERITEYQR